MVSFFSFQCSATRWQQRYCSSKRSLTFVQEVKSTQHVEQKLHRYTKIPKQAGQRHTRPTAASASLEPLLTHSELLRCREENKLCVQIPSGSKFKSNTRPAARAQECKHCTRGGKVGWYQSFMEGERSPICLQRHVCAVFGHYKCFFKMEMHIQTCILHQIWQILPIWPPIYIFLTDKHIMQHQHAEGCFPEKNNGCELRRDTGGLCM